MNKGEYIIPIGEVHRLRESEIQKPLQKYLEAIEEGLKIIDYEKFFLIETERIYWQNLLSAL